MDGSLRQGIGDPLAPFHGQHTGAVQVVEEAGGIQVIHPGDAVKIEVAERHRAAVFLHQGKGGAGDPIAAAQAPGQAHRKGGFSGAHGAGIGQHIAGAQQLCQPLGQRLRLGRAVGGDSHGHLSNSIPRAVMTGLPSAPSSGVMPPA